MPFFYQKYPIIAKSKTRIVRFFFSLLDNKFALKKTHHTHKKMTSENFYIISYMVSITSETALQLIILWKS